MYYSFCSKIFFTVKLLDSTDPLIDTSSSLTQMPKDIMPKSLIPVRTHSTEKCKDTKPFLSVAEFFSHETHALCLCYSDRYSVQFLLKIY